MNVRWAGLALGMSLVCAMSMRSGDAAAAAPATAAQDKATSATGPQLTVGWVKVIVDDLAKAQDFYTKMLGFKEVKRYEADEFTEVVLNVGDAANLSLVAPKKEAAMRKSPSPVFLVYTSDYENIVKAIKDAGHSIRALTGNTQFTISIAQDPSGNAVEILSRPGPKVTIGGKKLIVDSRQPSEAFYQNKLGLTAGTRYQTAAYDEIIMTSGRGPSVAVFQSLQAGPVPKSALPVVAFITPDLEASKKALAAAGVELTERKVGLGSEFKAVAGKDVSGYAFEIVEKKADAAPAAAAPATAAPAAR